MSEQKKKIILAIVLASIAVILLGGVSLSLFPSQQTSSSRTNSEPTPILQNPNQPIGIGSSGNLELTMTVEKTEYSLGEPVTLNLTITNISDQTIDFTHTGLDFDFQVYNGTNNVVYQYSNFLAIAQFIAIEPLQAGGSISANLTWPQTCNFNVSVEGIQVSPGTYNIIGQSSQTYGIVTTPIQITIDPES